jgi:hypothetical protein
MKEGGGTRRDETGEEKRQDETKQGRDKTRRRIEKEKR